MSSRGGISGDFPAKEVTLSDFRINDVRASKLTLHSEGYHGGGDGLVAHFCGRLQDRLRRSDTSVALTSLEQSVGGHLAAFVAERSGVSG
jgi:hypothetical protein